MTHELLYTSAPRGLRPGSSGYCVVSQTEGTPRALAERLEGLSVYRHVAIGPDPAASGNPVAVAHAVVSAAGRTYHVLSRIADTGLDHTGRSNFLAHHVALGAAVPPQGPAAVCANWPFETAWDGDVGERGPVPPPPPAANEPRVCAHWQEATGDAGWGGALAAATDPSDPATVVYAPGQDVLALLDEALALLPPAERWRVTFNTYYTKGAGECQWRCVPAGSPEARAALAARRGLVVRADMNDPSRQPPEGRLVTAARTGVVPSSRRAIAPTPPLESRGLTGGFAPRRLGADSDPGIAPDPNEPDTPQELEDRPAARRAQFAPPAPPPRGSGQLVLGLALGALVAVVVLLLVEVGAQASLLRLAGVKGKDETEAEKARDDAVGQADSLKGQIKTDTDALRKRLADAEGKAAKLQDEINDFRRQSDEKLERVKREAVEEYKASLPSLPNSGGNPLANMGIGAVATENKRLCDENKKLREELKKQPMVANPPAPPAPAAQTISTGLPVSLTKDEVHVLAELPAAKYTLDLVGNDDKVLKCDSKEPQKLFLVDPTNREYHAEVQISDAGVLSVRGRNLSRRPFLSFAAVRLQAEGRAPVHYYLLGPQVAPKIDLTADRKKYMWLAKTTAFVSGASEPDMREPLQGAFWSGTATLNMRGVQYALNPVEGTGSTKLVHEPTPNEPAKIVLTYDQRANEIKLEVENLTEQDTKAPPKFEADLVREVKGPDGKPIRQTVLRIR